MNSGSHRKAPISRSVEQVFPQASSSQHPSLTSQKMTPSFSKKSGKEDKSLYEQLKQQREKHEDDSDWEDTSGSIKAPVVLEDEDIEFLDQLKKKKEESFRSLDEQVEKFKERRHNLVLIPAQEQVTKEGGGRPENNQSISVTSCGKRKFGRLPNYLKTKEKRTKVASVESNIIPSLIPYSSGDDSEGEKPAR
ncbi:hypothetical protein GpartN1_g7438.t1 [Galdieria partita]|uniref:FAM192A/Fyv6 N-terminal domain-containing protein n=1 Tax=Galdieria partita TaxID=83374 RepID=A0A9C7Q5B2_9RHOD|nr:hypothetical protein GpartN1_g7438.t1 [Galdieria partita]